MHFQLMFLDKRFGADVALKWSISLVDQKVVNQLLMDCELKFALETLVNGVFLMNLCMFNVFADDGEGFFTNIARKLFFFMHPIMGRK